MDTQNLDSNGLQAEILPVPAVSCWLAPVKADEPGQREG